MHRLAAEQQRWIRSPPVLSQLILIRGWPNPQATSPTIGGCHDWNRRVVEGDSRRRVTQTALEVGNGAVKSWQEHARELLGRRMSCVPLERRQDTADE